MAFLFFGGKGKANPRLRFRRKAGKGHLLAGLGMGERQLIRPQGKRGGVLRQAVLSVASQGQAPRGELHPDLVGAARFWLQLYEGQAIPLG